MKLPRWVNMDYSIFIEVGHDYNNGTAITYYYTTIYIVSISSNDWY